MRRVSIDTTADVNIGDRVILSEDVTIYTHDHMVESPLDVKRSALEIGDRVYIGAKSIILQGVQTIGPAAYIGAGSVVTKDVPAGEVWAGNPARRIK